MKTFAMLSLAGLLAACDHPALTRRYPPQSGGSPGVYDAGGIGACPGRCSMSPGAIFPYDGSADADAELWAGLIGVWQICDGGYGAFGGAPAFAPADTIGIEFGPPVPGDPGSYELGEGNLFFLTQGPSGPLRGAGFEYQQTYVIYLGALYCFPTNNSLYAFDLKYSPCPREWELSPWGNERRRATLAPF